MESNPNLQLVIIETKVAAIDERTKRIEVDVRSTDIKVSAIDERTKNMEIAILRFENFAMSHLVAMKTEIEKIRDHQLGEMARRLDRLEAAVFPAPEPTKVSGAA